MAFLDRIEQRIYLPGDSDTERSQKALTAMAYLIAAPFVIINGLANFSAGLIDVGWVFVIFGMLLLAAFLAVVLVPASYVPVGMVIALSALAANLLAHLFAGGMTSGSFYIAWTVITPLLAALILDRRALLATMIPFLITVLLVVLLEPWARRNMPNTDPAFIISNFAISLTTLGVMMALASSYLVGEIENYRRRADDLLLNILPGSIASRLKESSQTIADGYNECTVLFADIVDFTAMTAAADPVAVVRLLNEIFSDFDDLAQAHGLEKIKTIGDAYMVAAGLPEAREDHTEAIVRFALAMLDSIENYRGFQGEAIHLRVGINSGPVVAGVIGRQKFIYDLWGDAVNVASRMESNGLANQIQVTEAVKEKLDGRYQFEERDPIYIKGKGMMVTYLLKPLGLDVKPG